MNILFATNRFYIPQSAGGSGSSTHDLCTSLTRKFIKCGVLCDLKPEGFVYICNRLKSKITSTQYPCDTSLGYPVYRGWNPVQGVREVISHFNPDVAVIQAGQPLLLANEFIKNNLKTIIYIRDVEFHTHGGDHLYHPQLNYIANSEFTAKRFKATFNLEAKVIPPIVHTENYKVDSNREKVVFICPTPLKGVELAFQLAEANPKIPFVFVESWFIPAKEKMVYQIRAKRSGNIKWLEKRRDMKSIYSQAKIMLVPSIWDEAWGRVCTESQISGIPTLASNRGGLPESVGEGGITLEPENNFDEWNSCLNGLWFNENIYDIRSKKAFEYSQREQIQPSYLLSEFIDFVHSI